MAVTLRPATPADAEALAALGRDSFVAAFGHLYRPEDLAEASIDLARYPALRGTQREAAVV